MRGMSSTDASMHRKLDDVAAPLELAKPSNWVSSGFPAYRLFPLPLGKALSAAKSCQKKSVFAVGASDQNQKL